MSLAPSRQDLPPGHGSEGTIVDGHHERRIGEVAESMVDTIRQGCAILQESEQPKDGDADSLPSCFVMMTELKAVIETRGDCMYDRALELEKELRAKLNGEARQNINKIAQQLSELTSELDVNLKQQLLCEYKMLINESRRLWYNWFCVICIILVCEPVDAQRHKPANAALLLNSTADSTLRRYGGCGICIWDPLSASASTLTKLSKSHGHRDEIAPRVAVLISKLLPKPTGSRVFFPFILIKAVTQNWLRPILLRDAQAENNVYGAICSKLGFTSGPNTGFLASVFASVGENELDNKLNNKFEDMTVETKWIVDVFESHYWVASYKNQEQAIPLTPDHQRIAWPRQQPQLVASRTPPVLGPPNLNDVVDDGAGSSQYADFSPSTTPAEDCEDFGSLLGAPYEQRE